MSKLKHLKQRYDRLLRRRKALNKLSKSVNIDEEELGFTDTQYIGHCHGTDTEEWFCRKCKKEWVAKQRMPCDTCHSKLFDAIRSETTSEGVNE